MAARRGDRYPDQHRDKERARDKDSTWDSTAERRWVSVEERDGRPKRVTGREKRNGPNADDTREREDRRDRERDREREKEPAWMDTYIPNPSSGNILGSKGVDGELDGIQAWKKGMKEKELKATTNESNGAESNPSLPNEQLDEIQLFRLLMKREEEKKKSDNVDALAPVPPAVDAVTNLTTLQSPQASKTSEGMLNFQQMSLYFIGYPTDESQKAVAMSAVQGIAEQSSRLDTKISPLPQSEIISPTPHPILGYKESPDSTLNPSLASLEPSPGGSKSSQAILGHAPQGKNVPDMDHTPSALHSQFNPPQGSRLLAFARTPSAAARPQAAVVSKLLNGMHNGMYH
jgi:zinc finger CCCH domain-containing protein 13